MSYYPAAVAVMAGPVILRFRPHEEVPSEVPVELRSFYSPDVWQARMSAVTKKASRYYKHGFEWVWMILSLAALIGVPIAVYQIALSHLPDDSKDDDKDDDDDDHHHFFHVGGFDQFWKARLISMGVWIALMILVFVPMHLWKKSGKTAVNQMLAEYEAQDRRERPGAAVPTFRMKMPGVISKHIKIVATIPPPGPSYYQPGTNVPPYLANGPSDPAANNYYAQSGPWGSGTLSQNTSSGSLPIYSNQGQRLPDYSGAPVGYNGEKNPFEDVKV